MSKWKSLEIFWLAGAVLVVGVSLTQRGNAQDIVPETAEIEEISIEDSVPDISTSAGETSAVAEPVPGPTVEPNLPVAAPVSDSDLIRAERARKEGETETFLQRRLEEGRIRDEQERRARVEKLRTAVSEQEPQVSVQPQQIIVAPITLPSEEKQAKKDQQIASGADEETLWQKISVGPVVGYTWYDSSSLSSYLGISNNFTAGLQIGIPLNRWFAIEGLFTYASYEYGFYNSSSSVGYGLPQSVKKNQYMVGIDGRVNLFTGRFRPFLGAGFSYVLNEGNVTQTASYYGSYQDSRTFHYLAGDLMAGLEYQITDNVTLGGRFQYTSFLGQQNSWNVGTGPVIQDTSDMYRALGNVTVSF